MINQIKEWAAWVKAQWDDHGTKYIGFITGILAALTGSGVIPEHHMKFYAAVIAVLTFVRGFINTNKTKE